MPDDQEKSFKKLAPKIKALAAALKENQDRRKEVDQALKQFRALEKEAKGLEE